MCSANISFQSGLCGARATIPGLTTQYTSATAQLFFLNIFYHLLVESMDAEPVIIEANCNSFPSFSLTQRFFLVENGIVNMKNTCQFFSIIKFSFSQRGSEVRDL